VARRSKNLDTATPLNRLPHDHAVLAEALDGTPVMIGHWSDLYLYNPDTTYHSGRPNLPRPFLNQVKSALDRYEELERPKPVGCDFLRNWFWKDNGASVRPVRSEPRPKPPCRL
jgi:hypothetical protein